MIIINKKLTPAQFREYIDNLKMPFWRRINKLVFHHTSSSTDIWQGSASMLHYWNLYRSRGMKAGPHIFVAPDGIWLFTPLWKKGQHAGPKGNKRSIGIEIVGKYFDSPPYEEEICHNTALATIALMLRFQLTEKNIFNHLYFDENCFCTPYINRDWIIKNMQDYGLI